VRTLLHDDTSAEDVTALAFERAYRRRSTFDARRGGRRAWLFGIARNAALDELRRQRRAAPLVAELADEDLTALDEQAGQSVAPGGGSCRTRLAVRPRARADRPEVPQDLRDITTSVNSAQDRLDEARAERRGLLQALGNATTQNRSDSLRARLRLVRGRIASAEDRVGACSRSSPAWR